MLDKTLIRDMFIAGVAALILVAVLIAAGYMIVAASDRQSTGDVLWGTLERGVQISGGSECRELENGTYQCLWELVVRWPDAE